MRGEIEKASDLTVKEPDRGAIAFARWNAFPSSPVDTTTRGDIKPGSWRACRRERLSLVGPESNAGNRGMRRQLSPLPKNSFHDAVEDS